MLHFCPGLWVKYILGLEGVGDVEIFLARLGWVRSEGGSGDIWGLQLL